VLVVNLGSPDAPTAEAVRRYLKEFLSDPAVVDWPRWIWLPILHGIILRTRPARSAAMYQRVWTGEGSPLVDISKRQASALQELLGDGWRVEIAMRYGNPSLEDGLNTLRAAGCDDVVVLPMFPQECRATTGSVVTAVEAAARRLQPSPTLHIVPDYATDEGYLEALVASLREMLNEHRDVDHIVFSFHGIPARLTAAGDPYQRQCESTAHAVGKRLQLGEQDWSLVYQSRFGPEKWLQPYASERVPELAANHRKLLVACPGFTADCLETIDEIGRELREDFLAAGGRELLLAPCLNDRREWIEGMADLVRREAR
jgi:ferrochelatase